MDKFNVECLPLHTVAAPVEPKEHVAYVGLDVQKETITIAVVEPGRQEPFYEGEIANTPKRVERKIRKLSQRYGG